MNAANDKTAQARAASDRVPPRAARAAIAMSKRPLMVGGFGTLVAVLMIALSFATLYNGRSEALDHASETSANLVSIMSNDIARNVELYDLSLRAVVDGAQSPEIMALAPALRRQVLFDRATTAAHLGGIYLVDAAGQVVAEGDMDGVHKPNLKDRDYFQAHVKDPNVGLFVSHPFHSRFRDGSMSIGLTRRVNAPDGSFAGVALLAIHVDYFSSLLAKIDTGPNGSVFIVLDDGTLLARKPVAENKRVSSPSKAAFFRAMALRGAGTQTAPSPFDGVRRIYTFSRIPGTPFLAVVAPAEVDVLANWYWRSRIIGGLTLFLGLSFMCISWLLAYSLRERAKAQAELERLAGTDPLTGLFNRRVIDRRLDEEWRRARRSGAYLSILFIDVDVFKSYNDTYGHKMGDEALSAVADCIEAVVRRPGDVPARYGGEEFVVLLADTPGGGALRVAEALRAKVESLRMLHAGSGTGVLTVSIGCATVMPKQGGDALALLNSADAALYRAKAAGRNRVEAVTGFNVDNAGERAPVATGSADLSTHRPS